MYANGSFQWRDVKRIRFDGNEVRKNHVFPNTRGIRVYTILRDDVRSDVYVRRGGFFPQQNRRPAA